MLLLSVVELKYSRVVVDSVLRMPISSSPGAVMPGVLSSVGGGPGPAKGAGATHHLAEKKRGRFRGSEPSGGDRERHCLV